MEKLTMQEEEVMIYIWELESCYVKDIVAKFEQPTPPVSYTHLTLPTNREV